MILPVISTNSVFPNDNVPESEKLDPKWGKAAARAIYARFCSTGAFFTYAQWSAMQEIRNYGQGLQNSAKYVNWFTNGSSIGTSSVRNNQRTATSQSNQTNQYSQAAKGGNRKAFANISYDIFSPMEKLSNVMLSMMSDYKYKPDAISIDKNTVAAKREKKYEILSKAKFVNPLAKQLGLPQMPVPFEPKDEQEMEMASRLGFLKTRQEVSLEKIAQAGFRLSKLEELRRIYNRDAIDFHFRCVHLNRDSDGVLKIEWVDPCNLVMLWNENKQHEPVAIGHIFTTTIQAIFPELLASGMTEMQIQQMAKAQIAFQDPSVAQTPWIWERKDLTTNKWLWMDFKLYVMKFEYLSTDYKHFAERKFKGKASYESIKNPEKIKDSKEFSEPDVYECNYWYEGNYIVSSGGQDTIYGWRKKPNQTRKGLNPMSSYVFDRILGEAPTSRVIGLLDDLMFAKLKLRAAVWAAAPKGYRIDVANAANIKIGGQEYDLFDQIHIHRQNGIRIMSTKFNAATGKYQAEVLNSEDNGIGPQGIEWLEQIASILNQIKDTLGITDIMAATPNQSSERLVGVMEQDINATSNSNWILVASEQDFLARVAEKYIHQTRIDIQYDEKIREIWEGIIGPNMIKYLDEMEGVSLEKMGMTMKAVPNEKEKDAILNTAIEMSRQATRDGSVILLPSSAERIRQLLKNDDVDEALWFMASEETAARQREQEYTMAATKANNEGAMMAAQAAEEGKRQTLQMAAQIDVWRRQQEVNFELYKESEIQKAKNDSAYQIQLLKGEQEQNALLLESMLQQQTGQELTGQIRNHK